MKKIARNSLRMKKIQSNYDWAIKKFYFPVKHLSLQSTYKMMLMQKYIDENGKIRADAPSWNNFRQYFYKKGYHKIPKKTANFKSTQKKSRIYQIDSAKTDVCLVSPRDRYAIIGCPYIYLAVDVATQLIAGVYVGLETGDSAIFKCLENTVCDKVQFCKRFDIDITSEQWPNVGLPTKVVTNLDQSYHSRRLKCFCVKYGVKLQLLSSFHSDQKPVAKRALDLIQSRYKPLLRGMRVADEQGRGRWMLEDCARLMLNLEEFTEIVIQTILYLNSGRWLSNNKTPAQAWIGASPSLLSVNLSKLH